MKAEYMLLLLKKLHRSKKQ